MSPFKIGRSFGFVLCGFAISSGATRLVTGALPEGNGYLLLGGGVLTFLALLHDSLWPRA